MRSTWVVCAYALMSACVTGGKIRTESDHLKAEIEKTRKSGALRCAPEDLARAEAHVDFALGELAQGNSLRADEHVRTADAAVDKARRLSTGCSPQTAMSVAPFSSWVLKSDAVDLDADGIPDSNDKCTGLLEDIDGYEDEDGCPDPDNDADGRLDSEDRCPLKKGPPQNMGCPQETSNDRDGDGVFDLEDRCPELKEDVDAFEDEDGCPDLDNDHDGLVDASDACPAEKGPLEKKGCPDTDRDADGFYDTQDACPDEPEDKDGFADTDGCPDLDNDGDGLPDPEDECLNEPGLAAQRGCPKS